MKQTRSPLYPIFLFVIINLIIFTLSRLGLAIWQADRVSAVAGWGQLFLQGLRMDIVALCYLFGVPALFTVLFHHSQIWKMILRIWLTFGSVFILFMELATPAFIETYDFRPNRLFIEYLIYFHSYGFLLLLETIWLCGQKFTPNELEITSCCSIARDCCCFFRCAFEFPTPWC